MLNLLDEATVRICCPHCGHEVFRVFTLPADPPVAEATTQGVSEPVAGRVKLDREFPVSTPINEDAC